VTGQLVIDIFVWKYSFESDRYKDIWEGGGGGKRSNICCCRCVSDSSEYSISREAFTVGAVGSTNLDFIIEPVL